jgi:hypothetical protein
MTNQKKQERAPFGVTLESDRRIEHALLVKELVVGGVLLVLLALREVLL